MDGGVHPGLLPTPYLLCAPGATLELVLEGHVVLCTLCLLEVCTCPAHFAQDLSIAMKPSGTVPLIPMPSLALASLRGHWLISPKMSSSQWGLVPRPPAHTPDSGQPWLLAVDRREPWRHAHTLQACGCQLRSQPGSP